MHVVKFIIQNVNEIRINYLINLKNGIKISFGWNNLAINKTSDRQVSRSCGDVILPLVACRLKIHYGRIKEVSVTPRCKAAHVKVM